MQRTMFFPLSENEYLSVIGLLILYYEVILSYYYGT